jgi:hypothetical protein
MTRDDAVALGWRDADNGTGTVTRAWDQWFFVDQDLRAWMDITLTTVHDRYEAEWDNVMHAPGDPDADPDPLDLLMARIGPLLPGDHEWITFSAVVREAVTAYEIYVTDGFDELLLRHGKQRKRNERTPPWHDLRDSYAIVNLDPKPCGVDEVIQLRNLLTHRRGELRTEYDRRRFADNERVWGNRIAHLTRDNVVEYLDRLGASTREIDPVLWAYSWGTERVPSICGPPTDQP